MPLFCLPDPQNQARTDPEVDKKWDECLFFVYLTPKIRPVRIRKQNKISKIWKNVLLSYLRQSSEVSDYGQISESTVLPVTEVKCSD